MEPMKNITRGHKTETGRIIDTIQASVYNAGVKVYNETGDTRLKKVLGQHWQSIVDGDVGAEITTMLEIVNLRDYWRDALAD